MQQHEQDTKPELIEPELAVLAALSKAAAGTSTDPSIYRTPEQLAAITGRSLGAVLGAVRRLHYARAFITPATPGGPWADGLAITELGEAELTRALCARVPAATAAAIAAGRTPFGEAA